MKYTIWARSLIIVERGYDVGYFLFISRLQKYYTFTFILKCYCIPSKIVDWTESFLTNGKQRVIANGTPSSWHDVIGGVPQASVLGLILFVIYINTLIEAVDLFLFADDNKLLKIIQSEQILHCCSMISILCITGH